MQKFVKIVLNSDKILTKEMEVPRARRGLRAAPGAGDAHRGARRALAPRPEVPPRGGGPAPRRGPAGAARSRGGAGQHAGQGTEF